MSISFYGIVKTYDKNIMQMPGFRQGAGDKLQMTCFYGIFVLSYRTKEISGFPFFVFAHFMEMIFSNPGKLKAF